jgi:FkbM family methyltransferase
MFRIVDRFPSIRVKLSRFQRMSNLERRSTLESQIKHLIWWMHPSGWAAKLNEREWKRVSERSNFVLVNGVETYVVRSGDTPIGRELFIRGSFDFDKFEDVLAFLGVSRLDLLIDVGANVGSICLPALNRGLANKAIAVEPDPINFRLLQVNALLNRLEGNIEMHNVAAAEANLQLAIAQYGVNSGDIRVVAESDHILGDRIGVVTGSPLDSLVSLDAGLTNLLWIDVQGYEYQVLQGFQAGLSVLPQIVMELWPKGLSFHSSRDDLMDLLWNSGYRQFIDINASEKAWQPIIELNDLYFRLEALEEFTDVLLTK